MYVWKHIDGKHHSYLVSLDSWGIFEVTTTNCCAQCTVILLHFLTQIKLHYQEQITSFIPFPVLLSSSKIMWHFDAPTSRRKKGCNDYFHFQVASHLGDHSIFLLSYFLLSSLYLPAHPQPHVTSFLPFIDFPFCFLRLWIMLIYPLHP